MIKIKNLSVLGQGIHVIESEVYEERVRTFSFLAQHHFKAELCRYIYIVIFGKHLSELF